MSASFAVQQEGPTHGKDAAPDWFAEVPRPQQAEPIEIAEHLRLPDGTKADDQGLEQAGYPIHQLLDMRHIDSALVRELSEGFVDQMNWIKGQPNCIQ